MSNPIILPYIILSTITLFLTSFLGLYVLFSDRKRSINKNFALLIFGAVLWIFSNFMADISVDLNINLFWSRSALIGPILVAYFFYRFSRVFPMAKRTNFVYGIVILILSVLFVILSLTKWSAGVRLDNGEIRFVPGVLYIPFLFYFFLLIINGLINILHGYINFSAMERRQVRFVILGISVSALFGVITNLILPLLGYARFVNFGPYFVLLFIVFTSYAVIRHNLFDVRVIATELLTIGIWMFLLVRVVLSKTKEDILVNGGLFVAVSFLGVFLIRSVWREVRQREKMEEMARKVSKAYEVEKRARKELGRLGEVKNQFIMASQHHLRTPLTSMRGYLDLLLSGTYGKIPLKIKETLRKFEISTKRLIKVVNEFLDITQFQLGKEVVVLRQGVDLTPIFKEVEEELGFEARARGLKFEFKVPKRIPKIKADSEKLKIAMFNIVDNAIKYTQEGSVVIKTSTADSKVLIAVKDTGVGIPKENQKELFNKLFERGKEAIKVHGTGRGIGLFITFHIIKAHNGRIWAESEGRGKGSTFYIELPVR